jgi:transcriptional regulator with XRE-family HTH domain
VEDKKNLKKIDSELLEIGPRLRQVREQLEFTLEKMSRATGISKSYISDFERGKKIPASKYLFQLNQAFKVNLNYVFNGKDPVFFSADSEKNSAYTYSFGKYEDEINDLLFHITHIPNALFAVLQFFSEYKENMADFIDTYLKKHEESKARENE